MKTLVSGPVVAVALLVGAAACTPQAILSSESTVHPRLQSLGVDALTRMFNRQGEAAKDIQVSATLWDLSYIAAFQEARATRREQSAAEARSAIEAWRQRFVAGQTAFRIRVELLDRPVTVVGKDEILDLRQWVFRLKRSSGEPVPYKDIRIEVVKQWKAAGGRLHHRLDGTVHFPGRVDPASTRWIELWASPPGDRPPVRLRWELRRP